MWPRLADSYCACAGRLPRAEPAWISLTDSYCACIGRFPRAEPRLNDSHCACAGQPLGRGADGEGGSSPRACALGRSYRLLHARLHARRLRGCPSLVPQPRPVLSARGIVGGGDGS